jgi:hypothetical protein
VVRDAEVADSYLVASTDEHDHRVFLGQVNAGDERVRGDELCLALQLGGTATHPSGPSCRALRFGVNAQILEGLLDDRNANAKARAGEMSTWGQLRIVLGDMRVIGAGLPTGLGQPTGLLTFPPPRQLPRAISSGDSDDRASVMRT